MFHMGVRVLISETIYDSHSLSLLREFEIGFNLEISRVAGMSNYEYPFYIVAIL